jgi:hypothetical protein
LLFVGLFLLFVSLFVCLYLSIPLLSLPPHPALTLPPPHPCSSFPPTHHSTTETDKTDTPRVGK